MTMVYVAVTQNDLQRQYHLAREAISKLHVMPGLETKPLVATRAGIPAVPQSLTAARHLLEMFRRQLENEETRSGLARLATRLVKISTELDQLTATEK